MILRTTRNGYWSTRPADRWQWDSEGAFFTEANAMALLRTPLGGQRIILFGKQLPEDFGHGRPARRAER
jgi:hypothetical protein